MKRVYLILVLLFVAILGYSFANVMKINPTDITSRKDYVGSGITRYDLGDVECFKVDVGNGGVALSCLRKWIWAKKKLLKSIDGTKSFPFH